MSRSKILFLPGIFLADCPETDDEESGEVLEISLDDSDHEVPVAAPKKYDELQTRYISKELWKKKTNLLCWSCGLRFDDIPYAIPIGWTKRLISPDNLEDQTEASDSSLLSSRRRFKEMPIMEMYGNFCHGGCASWYIMCVEDPKISNKKESMELLIIFHNDITGELIQYMPCADPKVKMHMYCGSIGVPADEFVKRNSQKLESYRHAVEKSNTSSVKVVHSTK